MMTFAIPTATMVADLASPASDLSWLAPLGFAAALWMVVLVAKGITRDRDSRVAAPETAPAELRRAA